jgi:hypothetical protein
MSGWIPIRAKVPKRGLPNAYIRRELSELLKEPQKDFSDFVRPWKEKPTIRRRVDVKKYKFTGFTGVYSHWSKGKEATPEDKLRFVARGTKVRYATMSYDFIPKTKKGVIRSKKGRGRLTCVSKMLPRPGIEARDIEKTVWKKNRRAIKVGMFKILLKVMRYKRRGAI